MGCSPAETRTIKAQIKRLEKNIDDTQAILGAVEANFELGDLPKKVYVAKRRTIEVRLTELEIALNNAKRELKGSQVNRQWVDWYKAFGDEVASKESITDKQKQEYIAGLVERIDVRYDRESNEHELSVQFYLPVVGDTIEWKDQYKKRGYELKKGASVATARIGAKRAKVPL